MYELGYHGTSTRAIAKAVGIESSSIYYHYPSKQHVLVDIMTRSMSDLIADVEAAVALHHEPADQLRAAIRAHVRFECRDRMQSFVTDSEVRALEPANRAEILRLRDRYERIFQRILKEGTAGGQFAVHDTRLTVMALMALCTGVSTWYQPEGRLGPDEIAERYIALALDGITSREPRAAEVK